MGVETVLVDVREVCYLYQDWLRDEFENQVDFVFVHYVGPLDQILHEIMETGSRRFFQYRPYRPHCSEYHDVWN